MSNKLIKNKVLKKRESKFIKYLVILCAVGIIPNIN